MTDSLLVLPEVQRRFAPYHKVHIYRLMKRGEFPQPVRIGPNRVAWRESELQTWLNERLRQFNPEAA